MNPIDMELAFKTAATVVFISFMISFVLSVSIPKVQRTDKYQLVIDMVELVFWIAFIFFGCIWIWK